MLSFVLQRELAVIFTLMFNESLRNRLHVRWHLSKDEVAIDVALNQVLECLRFLEKLL